MTILHRYFLFELVKIFLLILSCLFGLYVIIDYTSRASSLGLSFSDLSHYYAYIFINRLEVLVPFALLLAGIKTVCQSNLRQELVAMRASGHAMSRLLIPLVWVGLLGTTFIYVNTQWLLPHSLQSINRIEDKYAAGESRGSKQMVHSYPLNDGSRLLYVAFDHSRERFVQSYWVRSFDDIYRIRYLTPEPSPPKGLHVERLQRNKDGLMLPTETLAEVSFPDMHFNIEDLAEALTLPAERSLTQLWQRLPNADDAVSYDRAQIEAAFYKKLVMPWLCFIALLIPAPFCVAHRRPLRVFFIFAVSIFGLFSLFVWLSVGNTLVQSQLAEPLYILVGPIVAMVCASVIGYKRLS